MKVRLRTGAGHQGRRLLDVLAGWLPSALQRPLPSSALRKLVMAGVVRVDGRPARQPGRLLRPGLELEAAVDLDRLGPGGGGERHSGRFSPRCILYEDDALIAVDKPFGLPTVPTADPSQPSLVRLVEAFLADNARGGEGTPLGVHQRLDRDTSGVVVFVKDKAANAGLARAFAEREVSKVYDAVTERPRADPPPSFAVRTALVPRGRAGMAGVKGATPDGKPARTEFLLRETLARALLVEARPLTGRKHQIRVHLSERGMPILGDPLYGKSSRPARSVGFPVSRLMLHARRLAFRHPLTGQPLVIESPWPDEFQRAVDALRREAPLRSSDEERRPRSRASPPRAPRSRARGGAAGGGRTRGGRRP